MAIDLCHNEGVFREYAGLKNDWTLSSKTIHHRRAVPVSQWTLTSSAAAQVVPKPTAHLDEERPQWKSNDDCLRRF